MLNEKNKADKQSYLPEKLFKLTHTYTIQDKPGLEKNITDAFFLDKDLKRVVKIVHVN